MEQFYQDAQAIIRQTRELSLPGFGNVTEVSTKSSPRDLVTQYDLQIEEYLKKKLGDLDQSIGFVGEEGGGDTAAASYWLVDPIDGTGMYIHGLPFCTTQVALIKDGQVVFAAIYDFVQDELYSASKGQGAKKNDEAIQVSERTLGEAYLGYESRVDEVDEYFNRYQEVKKRCRLINLRNAGYECALVASGRLDGRIVYGAYGQPHDFAAGSLLVSEAGGIVANIGTSTYDFNQTDHIVANPNVFAGLTEGSDALFPITE